MTDASFAANPGRTPRSRWTNCARSSARSATRAGPCRTRSSPTACDRWPRRSRPRRPRRRPGQPGRPGPGLVDPADHPRAAAPLSWPPAPKSPPWFPTPAPVPCETSPVSNGARIPKLFPGRTRRRAARPLRRHRQQQAGPRARSCSGYPTPTAASNARSTPSCSSPASARPCKRSAPPSATRPPSTRPLPRDRHPRRRRPLALRLRALRPRTRRPRRRRTSGPR